MFLLYFLPIFLVIYYFADKRYKNFVILIASVFFYAWGAPKFVFILLASTYLNFYLVRWMHNSQKVKKRKFLLILSVLINIGLLAFFKYANFFVGNMNSVLINIGINSVSWTKIILPIGISFYTFQTLTYSVDVFRKVHVPLKKVSDYTLYIIMFPQLIAGPIVRYNHIADQITERKETNTDRLLGFYRFSIGLAKKILIANVLGGYADSILAHDFNSISTQTAWLGIIAFTFQIYFDFAGYSDMAIGIGRMIGFKFPENFNNPYTSKSITEFWKRWHMTLSDWFMNYLFLPLAYSFSRKLKKNRYGKFKANTLIYIYAASITFVLCGFWHGASWNFILWGAYHGAFLIIERFFLKKILKRVGSTISLIYTFFVATMGWVIFWIEDFSSAILYYKKLFSFDFSSHTIMPDIEFLVMLSFAVLFSFITLSKKGQKLQNKIFFSEYSKKLITTMFIIAILLLFISIASITTADFNPFIYFRF